jgi:peptidoglycan hydrolase-like protein with peptidoglycan-binding domain
MRRLILTTASVIALGAGLALAGTTQANAWSQHSGIKSSATDQSRAEITDVQQKLRAENLYQGKIDGMLGPQTRRALADYQKQNALRMTANLDRETRNSLLGNMGMGSPPPSATHTMPAPSHGTAQSPAPAQGGTGAAPSGTNPATGR